LEPPLCVVSNWNKKVYTILVWNTISGSSNLDICCYHCLILTLIFHLKVLINFFFFFIIIIIIIIITIIVVVIVLLLTIIYTINLSVVRPWSCRVIYYFDTLALGRRHQSFGRVINNKSSSFHSSGVGYTIQYGLWKWQVFVVPSVIQHKSRLTI